MAHYTEGYAAGLPILRRAVNAARDRSAPAGEVPWLLGVVAVHIWDAEGQDAFTAHHLRVARAAGALTELPLALTSRASPAT